MAFPTSEAIVDILAPRAASYGLDIESVKVTRAGAKSVVLVAVDADQRPDLDKLEVFSGEVSTLLDEAELEGTLQFGSQGYTLEVSTPGIDLPLTAPRHWRRNRSRKVQLTENDKRSFWRIGALNSDETAVILVAREGKNLLVREYELDLAAPAVVEIEFSNPPAEELEVVELSFEEACEQARGK